MESDKKRSLRQNRYLWGAVLQPLIDKAAENGEVITKETAKRLALIAIGHCEMKQLFGIPTIEPKPTRTLSVQEFEEIMERIRCWAAGIGVEILLPGEGVLYPAYV